MGENRYTFKHKFGADSAWIDLFLNFVSKVKIDSKEATDPNDPGKMELYEAQVQFLDELAEGLDRGVKYFVCLKARQLGISTLMLVLDIFWLYMHPGLRGAVILDTADNLLDFRNTVERMLESLPAGYRIKVKKHNRAGLFLANGSVLYYLNAGTKKNSGLGRSKGLSFVHASELCRWQDPDGFAALLGSLAEKNPDRLYIFESTALGYNLFWDEYKSAKDDGVTKKAFFIGWWAKELYRHDEGSREYEAYWGSNPELTDYEQETTELVSTLYNYDITPEQWSWYRYRMAAMPSEENMLREFPSTEMEAFVKTGNPFFKLSRVNEDLAFIQSNVTYDGFRYEMGDDWLRMKVQPVNDSSQAELRVWEKPVEGAKYVIGVDPAFGRSPEADRTVISVWRCFADKLVQVAEYASPEPTTQESTWVLAHLAGAYRDCMVNLEITGPGDLIMVQLKHLRADLQYGNLRPYAQNLGITDVLDNMRWFLWHRPDSMNGGYVWNFKTSFQTKMYSMNLMRDTYNLLQLIPRSAGLMEEMSTFIQDGDTLQASGRNKDDRVSACGLACYAWHEWVKPGMVVNNETYDRLINKQKQEESPTPTELNRVIIPYMFAQQAAEKREAALRQILTSGDY